MTLGILVEDSLERLLEDGGAEGVGQDHDAVGVVAQALHLEQTDLVQAPGKDVNSVSVVGDSLGEALVELR